MNKIRIELWKYSDKMYTITLCNDDVIDFLEANHSVYKEQINCMINIDSIFNFMKDVEKREFNEYYIMRCRYADFITNIKCELLTYVERGFMPYEC